jgi:hypothetical protein
LKHFKYWFAAYLKTTETLKNTVSPMAMAYYLVGNCGGAGLPSCRRCEVDGAQVQVQA